MVGNTAMKLHQPEGTKSLPEDRLREAGSFPIATVFGIPVRLHGSFLILMFVLGGFGAAIGHLDLALFLPMVLAVTTIHEWGHTFAAKRLGYPIQSIVLHPLKASALVPRLQNPAQELWIALAGPVTSLLTAAVIWGAIIVSGRYPIGSEAALNHFYYGSFIGRFVFLNAFIGVLNLVPALPVDGGHALRGLLVACGLTRTRATRTVVFVSLFMAVSCMTVGIVLASLYWMIFALMITLGTTHMMSNDFFFSAIKGLTVKDVMQREVHTVLLSQTLKSTLNSDLPTAQRFFPVTCGDQIFGILSRSSLEAGLLQGKGDNYVAELMNRQLVFVDPDEPLQSALERSRVSPGSPILVGDASHFLGMITLESIQKRLSTTRIAKVH
jgi:Zn-dependent protease/CBS domain-containing protein